VSIHSLAGQANFLQPAGEHERASGLGGVAVSLPGRPVSVCPLAHAAFWNTWALAVGLHAPCAMHSPTTQNQRALTVAAYLCRPRSTRGLTSSPVLYDRRCVVQSALVKLASAPTLVR